MKKGQTVYLKPLELGNVYRKNKEIKEAIIEKIGIKYITLKKYGQFYIKTGLEKTLYTPDYKLYEFKEDIEIELEKKDLINRIFNSIPKYSEWALDIEKLRQIAKIIDC